MMTGDDVRAAGATCCEFLASVVDDDWSVPVPGMDGTVRTVVAHAVNGPLWYAFDLWAGPDDAAFDLRVKRDAPNAALLASLRSAATVCAAAIDAAPPETRGFHPAGTADPSGFAAMACTELLVHTDDAARGLGRSFRADPALAERALARLFPWHEPGADPWQALLWATGRVDLAGRSNQRGWRWYCAPLSEWDGKPVTLRPSRSSPGTR